MCFVSHVGCFCGAGGDWNGERLPLWGECSSELLSVGVSPGRREQQQLLPLQVEPGRADEAGRVEAKRGSRH